MKKLIVLIFLLTGMVSIPLSAAQPSISVQQLFLTAEQDLSVYQAAKNEAIRQNLPISIYLPEGIHIQALGIENQKVVYGVVTNLAHPIQNARVSFFEEISQEYDLSKARIVFGKDNIVNESLGMPAPKEALQGSLLLIPESTADRVLAFDAMTGDLVDDNFIPSATGPLSTPISVQKTPWETLTISDQITDLVQEFDTSGTYIGIFAPAGGVNNAILDNIRAHNYRSNGNLVVAVGGGANDDAIAEFDQSGNYLGNFIANGLGGLNSPWDIFFRTSDVLVSGGSSNIVHRYDLSGTYLDNFGTTVNFPEQIAELQNGNIAVAGFSSPSGVYIFSSTGSYLNIFTGVTGNRGVWELGNGNLLTTNGSGVHEISGTTGALVRTIVPGISARFISPYEELVPQASKILISEFVVTPTNGEFIEIYNPNPFPVDLSDYYITDATFASGGTYYYNIVTGINAGGGAFGDFHARFPNGATINPGEYQTLAMHGTNFIAQYSGILPTYELFDTDPTIPDMREALPGSIANQGGLTNSDEVIILYYWDGLSDLVSDVDYVLYNSASPVPNDEAVDKTGIRRDGPDADNDSSQYLPDTPVANQVSAINSNVGFSTHRVDFFEGNQIPSGGNGVTGADETSEDLHRTFTNNSTPSPNAPWVPANTARVQIIHNAADPAAELVDIYLNGVLILDDFAFRKATGFLDLPAGIILNLGIAPGNSTSVADTIKNFSVDFVQGGTYIGFATGVLNPPNFAPNPDGLDIAFTIFGQDTAREASSTPGMVEFFFMHGVTDAPTVDIAIGGIGTVYDNVSYGDKTSYVTISPGTYSIDVFDSSGTTLLSSFGADFSSLADSAFAIFASGFIEPSQNQNGPHAGFYAALPNGEVFELPNITTYEAYLQVIHNAADPAADTVDVYLDGTLILDNFAFRTATPYLTVPALIPINIGIAPGNSTSAADTLINFVFTLADNAYYVAIANGVLNPSGFAPNPTGLPIDFSLWVKPDAQSVATSSNFEFFFVHGATDAPAVDVVLRKYGFILINDMPYGSISDYIGLVPAFFIIDIMDETGTVTVASYEMDLRGLGGEAGILLASGFLDPANNQNGPGFALIGVLSDGSVSELPISTTYRFFEDFETYTAGIKLAQQNPVNWTTWSNAPGGPEDAFVSNAHAYSGANSVVISFNNDLVKTLGSLNTGKWHISFQVYIPTGKAGYFNTLSGFTPNPYEWGMECYFDQPGTGRLFGGSSTAVPFNYPHDAWFLVELIVDLNLDIAQFYVNGLMIHSWQWTLGASGGGSVLRLDANDFFGATSNDEMYIDDYHIRPYVMTGVSQPVVEIPTEFALSQNYPNPFNPTTTIKYALKENVQVTLKVYNMLGQEVRTLVNGWQEAGYKQVVWDGLNNNGSPVASGIYIYQIQAGSFMQARKMILMK